MRPLKVCVLTFKLSQLPYFVFLLKINISSLKLYVVTYSILSLSFTCSYDMLLTSSPGHPCKRDPDLTGF